MSHAIVMADASNEASLICAGTTKLKKRLLISSCRAARLRRVTQL